MTSTHAGVAFWAITGLVTVLLGILFLGVIGTLRKSPAWSLADALSEEAAGQPDPLPAGQKPVMVASSSRLIALSGLLVILSLYLGFGYAALWDHFFDQGHSFDIKSILGFLFGGATLFAPYLANQLTTAFGAFTGSVQQASTPSPVGGGQPTPAQVIVQAPQPQLPSAPPANP